MPRPNSYGRDGPITKGVNLQLQSRPGSEQFQPMVPWGIVSIKPLFSITSVWLIKNSDNWSSPRRFSSRVGLCSAIPPLPVPLPPRAQTLNNHGHLHLHQGNPQAAFSTWQRSEQLYAQVDDELGRIGSLINQAQAQQVLGLYRRAHKTLKTVKQDLTVQSDPHIQAIGWRNLGNIMRVVGNLDESHQLLTQSLTAIQGLDVSHQIHAIQLDLGNTAQARGQTAEALAYYQQAAQSPLRTTRLQAQLNQLRLWLKLAKWSDAQALWPRLQTELAQLPASRTSVYQHIHLAQSLTRLRQQRQDLAPSWSAITQIVHSAVAQAQYLTDLRAKSYALGHLGTLYTHQQMWPQATAMTQKALSLVQSIDAGDLSYQWHWQLGKIYTAQEQRSAAINAYTAAFTTLESLRRDLVATNSDVQFSFKEQVEPVYRELVDVLLRSSPAAPSPSALAQARDVIEALQQIELENYFRSACLDHQRVKIEDVDQRGTAVIYPIILPDRIEVLLSLPNQPHLRQYTTHLSQEHVESTLVQLRQFLETPYIDLKGQKLAQTVYDWLIRPVKTALDQNQVTTLTFVLDGPLRNLPMAALHDGQQYLVEHYRLALTPGLRLLASQPLQTQPLKVLAAGVAQENQGFPALPHVPSELAQIQASVPGRVLLDETFTNEALQHQIRSLPFPIVHLATHGQFSSKANDTFLLTWDGKLKINDLSQLLQTREQARSHPIELLVLSACQTAEGDQRAALGLAGIALQAGARSTLASLWNIDDAFAARFATEFYQALKRDRSTKAEALRQAQLAFLANPDYKVPFYWAPYVLVGNWL